MDKLTTQVRLKQRGYVRGYWRPFSPTEDGSNESTNQKFSLRHVTVPCQYGGWRADILNMFYVNCRLLISIGRLRRKFIYLGHKRKQVTIFLRLKSIFACSETCVNSQLCLPLLLPTSQIYLLLCLHHKFYICRKLCCLILQG